MKLQVSNTNEPVWRNLTVSAELPKELKPLEELSKKTYGGCGTAKVRIFSATLIMTYGARLVKTL